MAIPPPPPGVKVLSSDLRKLKSPVATMDPCERYLIQLDSMNKTLAICLRPGQPMPIKDRISKLIKILGEKKIYKVGLKVIIMQMKSMDAYNRSVATGGAQLTWADPKDPNDTIVFIVSEFRRVTVVGTGGGMGTRTQMHSVGGATRLQNPQATSGVPHHQQQQRRKQIIGSGSRQPLAQQRQRLPVGRPNKPVVEVIELDSEDDDETSASESESEDEDDLIETNNKGGKVLTQFVRASTNLKLRPDGADEKTYFTVVKGNVKGRRWRLPSKTIVPASKALSCLYRIPDLPNFHEAHKAAKMSYGVHPFLGDQFVVVTPELPLVVVDENQRPKIQQQNQRGRSGSSTRSTRGEEEIRQSRRRADSSSNENATTSTSRYLRRGRPPKGFSKVMTRPSSRPPPPAAPVAMSTRKPPTAPVAMSTRKRGFSGRDRTPSSSSSSSSSSSDTTSDEDFKPTIPNNNESDEDSDFEILRLPRPGGGRLTTTTTSLKPQDARNAKCFSELEGKRVLRKGSDGRIYFNVKGKLAPGEYYKNTDLFENWDKFVRNESSVSTYYKTMFMETDQLTTFVIFHTARQQDGGFTIDRSVELVSDGRIKVCLESQDVTPTFMKYLNVETTNDLSALLINLINAKSCSGAPGFQMVPVYPAAVLRQDVWYSAKCSKVTFHSKDSASSSNSLLLLRNSCPACTELSKHLQNERLEMEKMIAQQKQQRKSNQQHIRLQKYKPPPLLPGLQQQKPEVRHALSELFLDFWNELGLSEPTTGNSSPPAASDRLLSSPSQIVEHIETTVNAGSFENTNPIIRSSHHHDEKPLTFIMPPLLPGEDLSVTGTVVPPDLDMLVPHGPFLSFSDLQINPTDLQMMNMSDLSSEEMIASLMNSSSTSGGSAADPDGILTSLGAAFTESIEMNNRIEEHSLLSSTTTVDMAGATSHGTNALMTQGTPHPMFPTFSLTDEL